MKGESGIPPRPIEVGVSCRNLDENMNAEIDFLLQIARTPQALRGAINLFSNAYDNENYTYAGLVAMAKLMGLQA